MGKVYTVQLRDGRVVDIEGDRPPTEAEALTALQPRPTPSMRAANPGEVGDLGERPEVENPVVGGVSQRYLGMDPNERAVRGALAGAGKSLLRQDQAILPEERAGAGAERAAEMYAGGAAAQGLKSLIAIKGLASSPWLLRLLGAGLEGGTSAGISASHGESAKEVAVQGLLGSLSGALGPTTGQAKAALRGTKTATAVESSAVRAKAFKVMGMEPELATSRGIAMSPPRVADSQVAAKAAQWAAKQGLAKPPVEAPAPAPVPEVPSPTPPVEAPAPPSTAPPAGPPTGPVLYPVRSAKEAPRPGYTRIKDEAMGLLDVRDDVAAGAAGAKPVAAKPAPTPVTAEASATPAAVEPEVLQYGRHGENLAASHQEAQQLAQSFHRDQPVLLNGQTPAKTIGMAYGRFDPKGKPLGPGVRVQLEDGTKITVNPDQVTPLKPAIAATATPTRPELSPGPASREPRLIGSGSTSLAQRQAALAEQTGQPNPFLLTADEQAAQAAAQAKKEADKAFFSQRGKSPGMDRAVDQVADVEKAAKRKLGDILPDQHGSVKLDAFAGFLARRALTSMVYRGVAGLGAGSAIGRPGMGVLVAMITSPTALKLSRAAARDLNLAIEAGKFEQAAMILQRAQSTLELTEAIDEKGGR